MKACFIFPERHSGKLCLQGRVEPTLAYSFRPVSCLNEAVQRLALFIIIGLILAIAPITRPDIPVRILEYVKNGPAPEVSLVAVGDIMLSRTVAKRMHQYGPDYPFASTTAFIRSADIAFGNLETSITPGEAVQPMEMSFRADPEAAQALKDAGFDILSLANNHTPNFGAQGLLDTFHYLDSVGIAHAGAGPDSVGAHAPAFLNVRGIRFAFLAYNDHDVVPPEYEAGEHHAGTAIMHIEDMVSAVKAAKTQADIVIVSMHSGIEYEATPDDSQIAFAHAAIDAGAEMVIGHHPHVVQTMEVYKGKYIFYSLGNFIFDQMFSRQTREGLTFKAMFTKEGLSGLEYHPVVIEDYAQPRLVEGAEARAITERLGVDRGL
jgi:poly-gamma-glutamate capsule biosynthesis protein CapA/YwtB (metallophosphatase superfamily)